MYFQVLVTNLTNNIATPAKLSAKIKRIHEKLRLISADFNVPVDLNEII
jgi:hypothetical protein